MEASTAAHTVLTVLGMFGLLKKDPKKKLRADYERLLAEAQRLQRGGDIEGYANKMAEAEAVGRELDAAES